MPVKFQRGTEYWNKFKEPEKLWEKELMQQTVAGVPSVQLGVTHEPPLQHKKKSLSATEHLPHKYMCLEPPLQRKKKPVQPHGSKSVGLSESGEEYVLLGSQKKFAPNVVYKAKPVNVSQEADKTPEDEHMSTPMAPRPDPPPHVVVDTGMPKHLRKSDKQRDNTRKQNRDLEKHVRDVQQQQNRDVSRENYHSRQQNGDLGDQDKITRQQNKHSDKSVALPEAKTSKKQHHDTRQQLQDTNWRNAKKSPPKPQQSAVEPKPREKSAAMKSNRLLQNGGLAPQEQAPSDYALKYKAGVAPPRGQGPKRLSEYQRQFAWKQGVDSSPLLDAEQVVYKSSSQIIPRKTKFNKTTEYRREFQPWESLGEPIAGVLDKASSSRSAKHKIQRSKSAEALTPDKRQPAGKEKVTSEVDPRLVQESLNPLRPYFPHGPYKNYNSEYAANFAAPQAYEYEQGTWKGANPPHLQTDQNVKTKEIKPTKIASKSQPVEERPKSSPGLTTKDSQLASPTNSWFVEVVELRRRAEEYKRRAQGTHFSRQHLVQLLAKQADLWDTASTSSMLSALSLEHPHVDRSPKVSIKKKSLTSKDLASAPPAGKKTAWGDDREPPSSRTTDESVRSASIVSTFDTQSVQNDLSEAPTLVGDETERGSDSITSPPGRIPTPKMPRTGLRHHLDRTTPLQGGALLSSPPRNKAASMNNILRNISAPVDSMTSASSAAGEVQGESKQQPSPSARSDISQTSKKVKKMVKPLYGMPTRDTHVLIDETASVDQPLITDYVDTPVKHAKHNKDKFPDIDVPSTIQEDTADTRLSKMRSSLSKMSKSAQNEVTLGDIHQRPAEDDVLSMSMRSVASSCSLASEVLQRARDRREQFWGVSGRA